MKLKNLLRTVVLSFFISYTATMFVTRIFCAVSGTDTLDADYILIAGVFCLGSVLPIFVFYSKREYGNKEWLVRAVIQWILEEAILLPTGHMLGMWEGSLGFIMFFLAILGVNLFIHFIIYKTNSSLAEEINERFRSRKEEKK